MSGGRVPVRNRILFKSFKGAPISFCLDVDNWEVKEKFEEAIVEAGGRIDTEVGKRTIVLALPGSGRKRGFDIRYVTDCLESDLLLDPTDYLLEDVQLPVAPLDVLYWETEKFPPLPEEGRGLVVARPPPRKVKSWVGYTREEQECIMKYIVVQRGFARIKGNSLYREMVKHRVCPRRTFESLKGHVLRVIPKDLYTFPFLTKDHIDKFQKAL